MQRGAGKRTLLKNRIDTPSPDGPIEIQKPVRALKRISFRPARLAKSDENSLQQHQP